MNNIQRNKNNMADYTFKEGYDLCIYQKYNCVEHGPWDILGEEIGNNILIDAISQDLNSRKINPDKLKAFLCNLNLIHDTYLHNSNYCKDNISVKAVNKWNKLRNSKANRPESSMMKLGLLYKYKFANMILGVDKTFLIVKLQRSFREKLRLRKIKALVIARYMRAWGWNPKYKVARELILKRFNED